MHVDRHDVVGHPARRRGGRGAPTWSRHAGPWPCRPTGRSQLADQQFLAAAEIRGTIDTAVHDAIAQVREQASAERDAAVTAALQQSAVLQREQLGSDGVAGPSAGQRPICRRKKDVIDARLDQVHAEMRGELNKLSDMVAALGRTSAESFGSVTSSLQAHAEVANTLAESTRSLREALANPQVRGQWGERMAEDVLRLAGFHENINYVKQTQIEGGTGRPDYTFPMPKGHALYMDVKFPMASYLRYLEVEHQRRARGAPQALPAPTCGCGSRNWPSATTPARASEPSVDYVLLFIPNEQLTGFIHEHDSGAARRGDGPAGRAVLAADAVRLPRRDPPGVRQLHDRADERRDPQAARHVRRAVAQVRRRRSSR